MTPNREDYLKLIFELGGDEVKVNNKQIVSGLDVSAASVSEMISKLVKEDLVEHSPYQGVQLTEKGLKKPQKSAKKPLKNAKKTAIFLSKFMIFAPVSAEAIPDGEALPQSRRRTCNRCLCRG